MSTLSNPDYVQRKLKITSFTAILYKTLKDRLCKKINNHNTISKKILTLAYIKTPVRIKFYRYTSCLLYREGWEQQ